MVFPSPSVAFYKGTGEGAAFREIRHFPPLLDHFQNTPFIHRKMMKVETSGKAVLCAMAAMASARYCVLLHNKAGSQATKARAGARSETSRAVQSRVQGHPGHWGAAQALSGQLPASEIVPRCHGVDCIAIIAPSYSINRFLVRRVMKLAHPLTDFRLRGADTASLDGTIRGGKGSGRLGLGGLGAALRFREMNSNDATRSGASSAESAKRCYTWSLPHNSLRSKPKLNSNHEHYSRIH